MDNVQVINLVDVPNGWLKLMLHFQNSTKHTVFRCTFPNKDAAVKANHMMCEVIRRRSTWFDLIVALRGCDVYVVKVNRAKNVEVRHE